MFWDIRACSVWSAMSCISTSSRKFHYAGNASFRSMRSSFSLLCLETSSSDSDWIMPYEPLQSNKSGNAPCRFPSLMSQVKACWAESIFISRYLNLRTH